MTTKEILDLVLKLTEENKKIAGDYKTAMSKLDKAVKKVEESEKKLLVVYKTPIAIGLTLLFVLISLVVTLFVMRLTDTCLVNLSKKDTAIAVKSCKELGSEK